MLKAAKESATSSKAKLNTESADTKKTASKQDTTQILFKVQISASGRKWIWNLRFQRIKKHIYGL
jgi:N-acetylmuramoyl-L-alanine amidase